MIQILLILTVLMIPLWASADPFIKSTNTWALGTVQPTHCYIYIDAEGTASLKNKVSTLGDGSVFCEVDIGPITIGIHTAEMLAVIEVGGAVVVYTGRYTMPKITKETCGDTTVCTYKYQLSDVIYWYK